MTFFDVEKFKRNQEIARLKAFLESTDYQAIKFAEGEMSAAEYEPIKEKRREARAEINRLEGLIKE